MLKELVATDGNHGDEGHELLEVALGVSVGVQTLHQGVQGGLVLHVLRGSHGDNYLQYARYYSMFLFSFYNLFLIGKKRLKQRNINDPKKSTNKHIYSIILHIRI